MKSAKRQLYYDLGCYMKKQVPYVRRLNRIVGSIKVDLVNTFIFLNHKRNISRREYPLNVDLIRLGVVNSNNTLFATDCKISVMGDPDFKNVNIDIGFTTDIVGYKISNRYGSRGKINRINAFSQKALSQKRFPSY